jgi:hypothetical protein
VFQLDHFLVEEVGVGLEQLETGLLVPEVHFVHGEGFVGDLGDFDLAVGGTDRGGVVEVGEDDLLVDAEKKKDGSARHYERALELLDLGQIAQVSLLISIKV